MLQGLKNKVLPGMLAVVMMGLLFASCNNASETEEATPPVMETPAPDMQAVPDSLPPIDTTARSRPEPRKT